MDNILKYIQANKDLTYQEKAFNEIDALIYSLLPYIDFRGLINHPTTIKNAYERLINKFSLKTKDKFTEKNKSLLKALATSKRFQNNIIDSYACIESKTTQFGAITIKVPHLFKFIAFEGTNDLIVGWEENFMMSYRYPIPAQIQATKYLKENIKLNDLLIYVGGHSKGGNLAMYALMEANFLNRYKIAYAFNYDGPGFAKEIVNSHKYQKIKEKIRAYYPEESLIGMILNNDGPKKIIKSNALGIYQHNAHSWLIQNDKFIETTLSPNSLAFHQKIEQIFQTIPQNKRQSFCQTFFKILYNSGYTLKSELNGIHLTKTISLIKETTNLTSDEKKLLIEIIKTILINNQDKITK